MCGIIGYIGKRQALPIILEGLHSLEYRGYDSAGIAVFGPGQGWALIVKTEGRIERLEQKLSGLNIRGFMGLGHTRWATHGAPTERNAHPHWDCKKKIFVVHNGIIENYKNLKEELIKKGHRFVSQTDTEVLPHLIEEFINEGRSLENAVRLSLKKVTGAYAIAAASQDEPRKIVFARCSSPLLVGLGRRGNFVASDAAAILGHTKKVVYLNEGEMGVITPDNFKVVTLDNHKVEKSTHLIEWEIKEAQKQGFPHFMLKEIYEEPEVVRDAVRGRILQKKGLVKLGGLSDAEKSLKKVKRIIIVSCGTSYFAGLVGKYMLEEYAILPAEVEYASEFRYRKTSLGKSDALLAISQSGETADTLAAVKEAKKRGVLTLGIVNVVGSSIAREVQAGIYNHAGPEIGVASTKAFVSQLTILALLALYLAEYRGLAPGQTREILAEIQKLPDYIQVLLQRKEKIRKLAGKYCNFSNFLFLGRKYNYPVALEGALKLKEISYIHAEGYSAGEMKHGPIALIDKEFPTFAICPRDSVYSKTSSNLEEIKAREGKIIALATEGDKAIGKLADDVIYIPRILESLSPILSVVPLQFFAYFCAVLKGLDPDKPRNLAKSVTVE